MKLINDGAQSEVYEYDDETVYKKYKKQIASPIDLDALKIMYYKINQMKRIMLPIRLEVVDDKILGQYSRYIKPPYIDLSLVSCADFYTWYLEVTEEVKILAQFKIRVIDAQARENVVINNSGPYLVDIEGFKYYPLEEESIIEKANCEEIKYCFLNSLLRDVGAFSVFDQSLDEALLEIASFEGTLREYLHFKNTNDYETIKKK